MTRTLEQLVMELRSKRIKPEQSAQADAAHKQVCAASTGGFPRVRPSRSHAHRPYKVTCCHSRPLKGDAVQVPRKAARPNSSGDAKAESSDTGLAGAILQLLNKRRPGATC